MTLLVTKFFSKGDIWKMRLFKIMNFIKLSGFCGIFTLRQGTMLIAVLELTLTSFTLFLLLLGVTHAQDILSLASADLQELEDQSWIENNLNGMSVYITSNEIKLLKGQRLAFAMMFLVCTGLILSTIHLISCLLLLYGAIQNSSRCLLPWTSTTLLSLMVACFFLFMLAVFLMPKCKFAALTLGICFLGLELYSWLVVFSYYRELKS